MNSFTKPLNLPCGQTQTLPLDLNVSLLTEHLHKLLQFRVTLGRSD